MFKKCSQNECNKMEIYMYMCALCDNFYCIRHSACICSGICNKDNMLLKQYKIITERTNTYTSPPQSPKQVRRVFQ